MQCSPSRRRRAQAIISTVFQHVIRSGHLSDMQDSDKQRDTDDGRYQWHYLHPARASNRTFPVKSTVKSRIYVGRVSPERQREEQRRYEKVRASYTKMTKLGGRTSMTNHIPPHRKEETDELFLACLGRVQVYHLMQSFVCAEVRRCSSYILTTKRPSKVRHQQGRH